MQLPGIPPSGTPTASDFAVSFWANLYSGIISGIITGIVAGLVIWIVQLIIDKKRIRKSYKRELIFFRKKLHSAFSINQGIVIENALSSESDVSKMINKLLEINPVESWKEELPNDPLFKLIADFMNASFDFRTKAGNLDLSLKSAMRAYNASQARIAANDASYRSYFFGRLHGLTDERLLPHIDMPMSSVDHLQKAFETLSKDSGLQPLIQGYLDALRHLNKVTEKFRNC